MLKKDAVEAASHIEQIQPIELLLKEFTKDQLEQFRKDLSKLWKDSDMKNTLKFYPPLAVAVGLETKKPISESFEHFMTTINRTFN